MDSRSVAFLEVMAAIGIVGLVAFLIFLVSRPALATQAASGATRHRSQWVELLLAAAAVLICVIVLLWQFGKWSGEGGAGSGGDADPRATTFFFVMMIIGAAGLVLFLVAMFWRIAPAARGPVNADAASADHAAPAIAVGAASATTVKASHETPSATRLLGLLALGIAYLVVNWSSISYAQQYQMMLHLMYPAGFIVALVMLFDKASRAWHIKPPAATLREWLYCDAVLALYLFGYLNLLSVATMDGAAEAYRGMFWDFLHVAGLLLVLWIVDRKTWRLRLLCANAWLIVLPLLLLVWRSAHGVEMVEPVSWWGTIWPFLFLALVFFVLEVIVLIAGRDNPNDGIGIAKDVVYLVLYVAFLIAGRPALT